MKPKIIKQQAFDDDWFMFYCGKCGRTIDCNMHPSNCVSCGTVIEWPKAQGEPPKNDLTTSDKSEPADITPDNPKVWTNTQAMHANDCEGY